jgi:5-methylcytosine-specific restriction endonuclease McrA
MRTPNCKCVICGKSLYRRPRELAKVRWVACLEHRDEAKRLFPVTEAQKNALELGREKGTNHLDGIPKSKESNRKRAKSISCWCKNNLDRVTERGKKTRGENHYNWRGGSSRLNSSIRRLTENRKWMDAIKARDNVCVRCGSVENLESHHIKPLAEIIEENGVTNRDEARKCIALWDLDNGITLCRKCHYEEHGRAGYED